MRNLAGMTPQELFVALHDGLPRQGPGSEEATLQALHLLEPLPPNPRFLDMGCGPGAQTLVLARFGEVTAVDLHQPFLDELAGRAAQEGLADRVHLLHGSMEEVSFKSQRFDVIWSEGSAYVMQVHRALHRWKGHLKPVGGLALSELTWLTPDPPAEVRAFWDRQYPDMRDVQGNLQLMGSSGYQVVGHFVLPGSAWWDDYYTPMEARIAELRERYASREDLLDTLDEEAAEIELYRRHSDAYGYVFYVLRSHTGAD